MPVVADLESSLPRTAVAPERVGGTLVDWYLSDQQELTAVERFSQAHQADTLPLEARRYSALLPATPLQDDQQYAFEVDLDACSGCKACVAACNSLNGLDESETWRDVGLLYGGSDAEPFVQHVTTACHHCLDPACLNVCPVAAYEKDGTTGIVKHLDDQCIGCQYCILACPYDVPKYNRSRGIVRKCDMCSSRLAVAEAPACVQSCPNSAIRITAVSRAAAAESCEIGAFLQGAPDPQLTQPTTHYKTNRVFPRNTLPADYYSVHPEHAHWALVLMLVFTQLSVGAFLVDFVLERWLEHPSLRDVRAVHAGTALFLGLVALGASTLHLGRPHLAFRAVIGLRTSWLSREILAFGLFALCAVLYAGSIGLPGASAAASSTAQTALEVAVVVTGVLGIVCSIMIYHCTKRALWNGPGTAVRFLLTTVILGLSTALVTTLIAAQSASIETAEQAISGVARSVFPALIAATSAKLLFEAALLGHLRAKSNTPLKRSARLMVGELARPAKWRFSLGIAGGVALPLVWMWHDGDAPATALVAQLIVAGQFVFLAAGELFERFLFFTTAVASRMPGALRT